MSEWINSTVGQVTLYQRAGGTPTATDDEFYGGDIPFVTIEDITKSSRFLDRTEKRLSETGLANSAAWLITEPHILYSMYATVGKPIINRIQCATNQAIIALKESPLIDRTYLYYQLLFIRPQVYKFTSQTTQSNLNAGTVKRLPIAYPKDIKQQEKIAEILTSLDIVIEKTESLITKYQQIKAGLMHDLFTRGVTANGKLRPPREQAPELYKETPIGWIPKEWGVCQVQTCGEVKLGRQRSPDQHSGKWTMPYLRVANVFDGFIDFSDILEMDFTPNERRLFSVIEGDIFLNEGQSLELVGRSSIYHGASGKYCFQNTLIRFRCNSLNMPDFFGYLFKLWLDGGYFQRISKQTTSVAHLGADRFARMVCPSVNLDEQRMISYRLNSIDKQIEATKRNYQKFKQEKYGLMHDLLTGCVRVPAVKSMEV